MWQDLLAALALMLIIEGLLPFLSPKLMRQALYAMAQMDERGLRISGLISMALGLALLYGVR